MSKIKKDNVICCSTCMYKCALYSEEKKKCLDPYGENQIRVIMGIKWKSIWKNAYNNWTPKIKNHLPED